MNLYGHFELEQEKYGLGEPLWVTLVIQHQGDQDVFVFVPRGRADGLEITIKQGNGIHLKNLLQESEPGLMPEQRLRPNGTLRQRYQLSEWLIITEPGDYRIECAIEVEGYTASLRQDNGRRSATRVWISTDLHFTIVPAAIAAGQPFRHMPPTWDMESFMSLTRAAGKDPRQYREAAAYLVPIFQAMADGKQPDCDELNREVQNPMPDVEGMLKWMAEDHQNDVKITAIQAMGFLGWEGFVDFLGQYVSSGTKPERLAAIGALGEIPSERAVDALRIVVEDPDSEIRLATAAALFKLSSQL